MSKSKNSAVNKKLKALRKDVGSIRKTVATKKGLGIVRKAMVSKKDLNEKFERLALELVRQGQDLKELKEAKAIVAETREHMWMILDRLDVLARGNRPSP